VVNKLFQDTNKKISIDESGFHGE